MEKASRTVTGKIKYFAKHQKCDFSKKSGNTTDETERLSTAIDNAIKNLEQLCAKTSSEMGKETAEIFETYKLILNGDDFHGEASRIIIEDGISAECAISSVVSNICNRFSESGDDSLAVKAADVADIGGLVLKELADREAMSEVAYTYSGAEDGEPYILVCEELLPSEFVRLNKDKLLGLIIKRGTKNSHVAILARAAGIPVLFDETVSEELNGRTVTISADNVDIKNGQCKGIKQLMDIENVKVYASINSADELLQIPFDTVSGIGLFRTEYIYMSSDSFPSEDEQFEIYKKVIESMKGKKTVIRTADFGADKKPDYISFKEEDNSALGVRGIRFSLLNRDIFKTQLRALFRASKYGKVSVLYPFVSTVSDVEEIKAISSMVKEQLMDEGCELGNIEEGIMIETPSAALISDQLAKMVDFFSIGTNDLIQYTMAADRTNDSVEAYLSMEHEAVLRLIKIIAENARNAGIECSVCGKVDYPAGAKLLMDLGIEKISLPPAEL